MRVATVIGTRPEAIKMAPVILHLRQMPNCEVSVIVTGQHRELVDQVLDEFQIIPDYDLDLMLPGQSLAGFASRCLAAIDPVLRAGEPHVTLAQGDTTTTFIAALAAFYNRIPFAHVEAGLRTGDLDNPYPEEFNRVATSRMTGLHFAPTEMARNNLLREGIAAADVTVTGNTVIDALLAVRARQLQEAPRRAAGGKRILVTVHRRESFGAPLEHVLDAIETILNEEPAFTLTWPVHPNPQVHDRVHRRFGTQPRVNLTGPLPYGDFIRAMGEADFIMSDSGGVQEEAPALGKPVLVLRDETERPEGVEAGAARLVGTDPAKIVPAALSLLRDRAAYQAMACVRSPYGDGQASQRIAAALMKRYGAR